MNVGIMEEIEVYLKLCRLIARSRVPSLPGGEYRSLASLIHSLFLSLGFRETFKKDYYFSMMMIDNDKKDLPSNCLIVADNNKP